MNFSSFRSVFESTMDVLSHRQIRTVAIIAEGVPERQTRVLIQHARSKGVTIIGPATVGGIKPGCFRIGNTGGMLDNIIASRLYRPGSVAYVARSGGMSNELNNIISLNSDGVYEGIAIGGDKYPGTTFVDHLLRYQDNPDVKGTHSPLAPQHATATLHPAHSPAPHTSAGRGLTCAAPPLPMSLLLCNSRWCQHTAQLRDPLTPTLHTSTSLHSTRRGGSQRQRQSDVTAPLHLAYPQTAPLHICVVHSAC